MATVDQLIKNFKNVNTDLAFKESMRKHEKEVISLNQDQLQKGERSDNSKLPTPYSKPYAKKRRERGLQTSVKDLKFTGDFYNQFKAVSFDKFVSVSSNANHAKFLENNYTPKIYGLNKGNSVVISKIIYPDYMLSIRKQLQL